MNRYRSPVQQMSFERNVKDIHQVRGEGREESARLSTPTGVLRVHFHQRSQKRDVIGRTSLFCHPSNHSGDGGSGSSIPVAEFGQ